MAEDSLESFVICAEDLGGLRPPPDPLPVIYVSPSEQLGGEKNAYLYSILFYFFTGSIQKH